MPSEEEVDRLVAIERESAQGPAEMRACIKAEATAGDQESAAILARWGRLDATIAARRTWRAVRHEGA
jgi:hypothetical protein